jgi:hypothetical protein
MEFVGKAPEAQHAADLSGSQTRDTVMLAMVHSARRACSVYPSSGLRRLRSHLGPRAEVVRKICGSDRACEHKQEDRIGGGAGPGQLRTDLPGSL